MKRIKILFLNFGIKNKGGRNFTGKITAPRKGDLVKKSYRFLDTKRNMYFLTGATILIPYLYDPNRSAHISLILYPNGIISYILAAEYIPSQKRVYNLSTRNYYKDNIGSSQFLKGIKNGSSIFNCELYPTKGSQILRGAGVSGIILKKLSQIDSRIIIKLKSGALRAFPSQSIASIGKSSNGDSFLIKKKKAGESRLQGIRPRTRPSAMNPVTILWVDVLKEVFIHKIGMAF